MASVSDNFNRANENPLASPWVQVENTLEIFSSAILGTGFGVHNCFRYGGAGLIGNHEAQARIASAPTDVNERFLGPCVRCQSGVVSYYAFHSDSAQTKIVQVIAGTMTTLTSGGPAAVLNDVLRLRAVTNAGVTTLTGYINDVQQLQVVAGTELTGGDPGMVIDSNFTPSLDDFFAQDVAGAAPDPFIPGRRLRARV